MTHHEEILVVGYPKSGNTWLTRLVAELVGCPVNGFFEQPNNLDVAIEGSDRKSNYRVYKGHQSFSEVQGKIADHNLIYVVRDVRDIVLSGASFFKFPARTLIEKVICTLPPTKKRYSNQLLHSKKRKVREMIRTLDQGNIHVPWCSVPWDIHVKQYLEHGGLIIRYEDLLEQPEESCKCILSHLRLTRNLDQIHAAINNQSFKTIKEKFKQKHDKRRDTFLRQGKRGEWKQQLSHEQMTFLSDRFATMLQQLGYVN
ncbi:MAG: sulfotransferase domain-containing protein [Cyanothece sp. SIO1E1]|nr:sulfotransferase domain-containing protein [Cyanothece sp. SIO1E1]